jgi:hypothetical protein
MTGKQGKHNILGHVTSKMVGTSARFVGDDPNRYNMRHFS